LEEEKEWRGKALAIAWAEDPSALRGRWERVLFVP
jgi:hypothetical protein